MDILDICNHFQIEGKAVAAVPYGNGHINDTYKVTAVFGDTEYHYILQCMNPYVFNSIEQLMSNIQNVTEWLKKEVEKEGGNPKQETLLLIPTVDGKAYAEIQGSSYRMYNFIENAVSLERPRTAFDFSESSVAYAKFIKRLTLFDVKKMYTVIPNFHNTPRRLYSLQLAVKNDKMGRLKSVRDEVKWVAEREQYAGRITTLLATGAIPTRVTHNDMKLNNVLLDEATGNGVAVIDLDTVMSGSLLYDFGDAIRFGCNTTWENDPDPDNVHFNIGLYKVYTKTFVEEMADYITPLEKKHLLFAGCLMTYECGMRFLTDYLNGDLYFKTSVPGENLDRARTQFKLVERIEDVHMELTDWTYKL